MFFYFVYGFKKPTLCLLCLDKTFVPCSFAWFMAIKIETGTFWDLIKNFFFVLFLRLWLQKLTPEVFMVWQDLCFCSCSWFCPTRDETLTRHWRDVPFASLIAIKFITEFQLQKQHCQNCWKIPWMKARKLKICPTKDWNIRRNHS